MRPMVSKSRSRILIPNCTQRSKNKGIVIGRSVGRSFFRTNIRLNVYPPEFNKPWKNLIDGKCIKSIQPLFRCIWDICICMLGHHIRNVLEHLKRECIKRGCIFHVLYRLPFPKQTNAYSSLRRYKYYK